MAALGDRRMINEDKILIEVCEENGIYVDSISNKDWLLLEDEIMIEIEKVLDKEKKQLKQRALELIKGVKFTRKFKEGK